MRIIGKPHYLWVGGGKVQGASEIGRPANGGRKILDACRRGGEKFWTSPEGGAKNFRLDDFFFNVPKTQFFQVFWVFWALFIFWSKGGRKFSDASRRGGAKF